MYFCLYLDRVLPVRHITRGQPHGPRSALRGATPAVGHAPAGAPAAAAAQAPCAGAPAATRLDAHAA